MASRQPTSACFLCIFEMCAKARPNQRLHTIYAGIHLVALAGVPTLKGAVTKKQPGMLCEAMAITEEYCAMIICVLLFYLTASSYA